MGKGFVKPFRALPTIANVFVKGLLALTKVSVKVLAVPTPSRNLIIVPISQCGRGGVLLVLSFLSLTFCFLSLTLCILSLTLRTLSLTLRILSLTSGFLTLG